ncbi:MAG: DNA circularization N-terminal domain-containing protein [Myxococcales bacterium]|nr:DNA circularization N-terminal domain-containing protein [Myxococcales bacterium]
MAWQDDLLPASLGGAPFLIADADARSVSIGRRTVTTEFPKRDAPAREDLGRRARRWNVVGFVLGAEYMEARDALMAVLESEGPHVFSDPWLGEFPVILAGEVQLQESGAEGGMARFTFALVESGDEGEVRIAPSTAAALAAASAAMLAAGAADLEKGLDISVGDALAVASGAVGKVTGALSKAQQKVEGALGLAQAAELSSGLSDLKNATLQLLNTPAALMAALNGIVAGVLGLIKLASLGDVVEFPGGEKVVRADTAIETAKDLGAVETVTPPPFPGGPKAPEATAAEAAIGKALKVATVANTASLFVDLPLDSTDAASAVLITVGELAATLLSDPASSDALFAATQDLKAALDEHLAGLASELPAMTTYTPTSSLPALLIAYLAHGDPTRDLEIVARNDARDPNFVTGGEPLKVLLDA